MSQATKIPLADLRFIQSEIEKILHLEKPKTQSQGGELKAISQRIMRETESSKIKSAENTKTKIKSHQLQPEEAKNDKAKIKEKSKTPVKVTLEEKQRKTPIHNANHEFRTAKNKDNQSQRSKSSHRNISPFQKQ
jgi:hypothetical protein